MNTFDARIMTLWVFYIGETAECSFPTNKKEPLIGETYKLFLENSTEYYGVAKIISRNMNRTWEIERIS